METEPGRADAARAPGEVLGNVDAMRRAIEIDADAADLVAAMNAAFDLRDHAGRLPSGDRTLVGKVLEGSFPRLSG